MSRVIPELKQQKFPFIMPRTKVLLGLFKVFLCLDFHPSEANSWVKAGYWYYGMEFPISDINSALYTHLLCAFADVNSSSYELSIPDEQSFSSFTRVVKERNPTITSLLSIGGGNANYAVLSSVVSNVSTRNSFIQSSMKIARLYGFQGLDLSWVSANTSSDMKNMGSLFQEWRAATKYEAGNSSNPELILTTSVHYSPEDAFFPVESAINNLNWIHVMAYDYNTPIGENFTGAPAALYDPSGDSNTDDGITRWINIGVSASKLVLSLPFYGYAWNLFDPKENGLGAPAKGPAISDDGSMSYKEIKDYIQTNRATLQYNATYVVNYCSVGSTWIGFDGVEVVKIKVTYARERKLLGYAVWQVAHDDNSWELSIAAAQQIDDNGRKSRRWLVIVLTTTTISILLFGVMFCFLKRRLFNLKMVGNAARDFLSKVNKETRGEFHGNAPDLQVFSFSDIQVATDGFSIENKVGEGGYGPVYKGTLPDGQEIAVKKLSKTSNQGFEEFKNEVTLTSRLQHVNLVRLLGFYIDRGEQMLVYEYMPNKSLDYYLFDSIRRYQLDWRKRVNIIEGVIQGLLYLQEYSRFTIIHRDLKASNILLDHEMKPKISDFGIARIFNKDELEANTNKIVGTYGYIPPEYLKEGLYSTKLDVYSFGILLLQIISGRKTSRLYGEHEHLNLMEYAYQLWKEEEGTEFVDASLDDSSSPCKLMRCMQIALLCIQENANDRPSMLEISSMLKNKSCLAIPKKPAFSTGKDTEQPNNGSVNDATVSELMAR